MTSAARAARRRAARNDHRPRHINTSVLTRRWHEQDRPPEWDQERVSAAIAVAGGFRSALGRQAIRHAGRQASALGREFGIDTECVMNIAGPELFLAAIDSIHTWDWEILAQQADQVRQFLSQPASQGRIMAGAA